MKTMKLLVVSFTVVALSAATYAQEQPKPWVVADNQKNMKNPVANDEVSKKAGMALYNKNCASCHGKVGIGDGVKARALKTFPGDFSKPEYQNQTDGEQFFKSKIGRGEMPKYEGKLSDNDIWNTVNYMRSFKKPAAN